jgi:AcrR family transcriptional regulator
MTTTRLTRGERTALTRRELLGAAERRFFELGYHATTLDEIADDAGYTKGAVYSTFHSKAGLFLAVFDEVVERRLAEVRGLMDEHGRRGEVVAALARQPVDDANARLVLLAIEFLIHAAREPQLLEQFSVRYRRLRDSIAALTPAGSALEPERWAIVTLALANGLALERLIDPAGVPGDLMAAVQARMVDPADHDIDR